MTSPGPSSAGLDRKAWRSGPERTALLNSPDSEWTRTPYIRRLLVVGYLATALGMAAAIAVTRDLWLLIALLIGIVVSVFLIGSLNTATRGLLDLKARDLDERQHQQRGAVYQKSYRIAFAGSLAILVAATLAANRGHLPVDGRPWSALLFGAFLTLMMLPTLVAAWNSMD